MALVLVMASAAGSLGGQPWPWRPGGQGGSGAVTAGQKSTLTTRPRPLYR